MILGRNRSARWAASRVGVFAFLAVVAIATVGSMAVRSTPAPVQRSPLNAPLSTLHHTVFTSRDGAPEGVTAFAQGPDGFLWVGTHYGLYLFDGVRFEPRAAGQLQSSHIHALWADTNGDLWIGFSIGGVSLIHAGNVTNYQGKGLPPGTAFDLARTSDGALWVATTQALGRMVNGQWHTVGDEYGMAGVHPERMALAADGTLWVVGNKRSYRLAPHQDRFETLDEAAYSGTRLGLAAGVQLPNYHGSSALIDSSGAYWQDTNNREGIVRYRWPEGPASGPPTVETIAGDALSGAFVFDIFEDREGNVWVGTNGGIDRFRRDRLNAVPFGEPVYQPAIAAGDHGDIWVAQTWASGYHVTDSVEHVPAIPLLTSMMTREADGTIWLGSTSGVMQLVDGRTTPLALPSTLKTVGFRTQAMARQGDGSLWISISGQALLQYKSGSWFPNGNQRELPTDQTPLSMNTDQVGALWLGYPQNNLYKLVGDKLSRLGPGDGISVGAIQVIGLRGARVWIGGERGVEHLVGGRFMALKGNHDELFEDISGIVETEQGDLWLNGAFGLYRIKADQLLRVEQQPDYRVSFEHFTSLDGLKGAAVQIRPTPTLIEGSDGRLWASTESGVVWVDPKAVPEVTVDVVPVVQGIVANGVTYPGSVDNDLPKGTKNFRIAYTAPLLGEPERIRFRYRLLGFDRNWQDADGNRTAYFTNLPPGKYTFQVQSKTDGGEWGGPIGQSTFVLLPSFYQTWWFYAACALVFALALWSLHLFRMRRLTMRMQIRRHERERVAQDLHDTLLQTVQALLIQVQRTVRAIPQHEPAQEMLKESASIANMAIAEGRDRIVSLQSFKQHPRDPSVTLELIGRHLEVIHQKKFLMTAIGHCPKLSHSLCNEIVDIAREAMLNAFQHSGGKSVALSVTYGTREILVEVADDGRGIDTTILEQGGSPGHWGLVTMRERAKDIGASIRWNDNLPGTHFECRVPLGRTVASMLVLPLKTWRDSQRQI
jgi:signal transduction histidine kinase/ligand-binding sensor domain-containing protein